MKTKLTKLINGAFAVTLLTIGAVTAQGALNDLFASISSDGSNGGGFIYKYTPDGVQSIFASGLSNPRGVAFDRFGNLFVANTTYDDVTQTYQGSVIKITLDGVQSLFAMIEGDHFFEDLAFDRQGNLFLASRDQNQDLHGPSSIYKFTPDGVQSTFGTIPYVVFGLAFDGAGNLFAADAGAEDIPNSAAIYKFTPDGTRTLFAGQTAFGDFHGPVGLAFDRFGTLFVSVQTSMPAGNDTILTFTPNGVGTPFVMGLDFARGLAFDRGGNLFVAERGLFAPPGDVLRFTPDGNGTVFAPDLDDPQFLAFQLRPTTRPRPPPHPRPNAG
jgi:sugar lactone lactonase YvrE